MPPKRKRSPKEENGFGEPLSRRTPVRPHSPYPDLDYRLIYPFLHVDESSLDSLGPFMDYSMLHTAEQRKTSEDHVEQLKKDGTNAVPILCSDTSWLSTKNMTKLNSLHLIVDTCMYRILMKEGRLCEVAFRKFKELAKLGKRIYVLNTFPTEFNELFLQIPRNARTLLNQESTPGQSNEGDVSKIAAMTGGSATDSVVAGTVGGNLYTVNGTVFNVHTGMNLQVSSTQIKDKKNGPSLTIGQGSQSNSKNQLVVTINDAENNQQIFNEVTNNKEKLLTDRIREVETEIGSVIIKLTVDKTLIMTDAWIQTVLKTIFYDILQNFFTEGTKFQVTVERHICIEEEEFLKLYSSYQSHDDCVPKSEFDSLKSKFEEVKNKNGHSTTEERLLTIKQEPMDDEYELCEEKTLDGKPKEGKSPEEKSVDRELMEEKLLEIDLLKKRPIDEKPIVGESLEGEPLDRKPFDKLMEEQMFERKMLKAKTFESFQSLKMRKFQKMHKADPEIDMKQVEIDQLMAEIQSLYAELDYMKEAQIFKTDKTETYPGGRMVGNKGLKKLDYEDVVTDPKQKNILQNVHGNSLLQALQNLITSGTLDVNCSNKRGMSLVMISALQGDKDIFDLLVRYGCSLLGRLPNGDNILHLACLGGNVDIVDSILSRNIVDIESKGMYGRTPVMKAAGTGKREVFDLLVSKGCNLNVVGTDYNKLIHVACMGDNVQIVKFLLENGLADIESTGMYKRTPVMIAASLGKKRVFDLLVRHGSDLAVQGSDKNNLLHVACMSDCVQIVHYLVSHAQVDMESRENYGKTPVMIAAERGNKRVFDLLVRKGCDLLVEDRHGNNILHAAVKGGNLQIINDVLLEVHLDPDSKNYFGQTANSLAVAHSRCQDPQRDN